LNLTIIVEGNCEEQFVKRILRPHLRQFEIFAKAIQVPTSKQQSGGVTSFTRIEKSIRLELHHGYVSTMFDLFRLHKSFPGFETQPTQLESKLHHLEKALADVISDWRFIPYIQAHEFEALLFSVPRELDLILCTDHSCTSRLFELEAILLKFDSPEHINGGAQTSPAKRLIGLYEKYQKVRNGLAIAGAKAYKPSVYTKTSLMLGLGETRAEIRETLTDLRAAKVDIVTFGQYLRPTKNHLAVERYVPPSEFDEIRIEALEYGFLEVVAGPLVRSSYKAEQVLKG
jgi:hypothetical protein